MPFQNGDRARLVDALQLVVTQDSGVSVLATLMENLEGRDTANGTDRAGQIQTMLDDIEEGLEGLESLDDSDISSSQKGPLQSVSITNQVSKSYGGISSGGQTTGSAKIQRINNRRAKILRYLDPYNYLARYSGVGRAIDG